MKNWVILFRMSTESAITTLIQRRNSLQAQYNQLATEPASYGISGSVNATNLKLAELRKEIDDIVRQIAALLGGAKCGGMKKAFPNYRNKEGIV